MIRWGLLLLLALAGCTQKVVCTTDVTDGNDKGTAKAAASTKEEATRVSLEGACASYPCRGKGADEMNACIARCTVDVSAGKLGAKTKCTP